MTYEAAAAENVPLLGCCEDAVLCVKALDHLDSPPQALRETARILRPGEELFLSLHEGGLVTAGEPRPFSRESLGWLLGETGAIEYTLNATGTRSESALDDGTVPHGSGRQRLAARGQKQPIPVANPALESPA